MSGPHTPSPWSFVGHLTLAPLRVQCSVGAVADVYGRSKRNAEANARLIALAPELLEYVESSASNGCATAMGLIARLQPF